MPAYEYRLIDKNTREEVFASPDFRFASLPTIGHRIHDADLVERYGAPAVVNAVIETTERVPGSDALVVEIIIDGVEERLNTAPQSR